ncbi:MAG TPA: C4-type zinc ribbon domain-containing protein [Acidimicrobiales bacterium]|nr:C4-type zinc ribbon domain-containing protein [Acidimicrobiales bacterium]
MSSPFDALLEIQAHDTRLDQLRHQLAALPARAARDAAAASVTELDAAIATAEVERADLARQQKRLDDEIESISAKRAHEEATLYGGSVTNARALQDLQEEIEALQRRITVLEDQDLEIMERIEPVDARLAELRTARTEQSAQLEAAEMELTAAEAELAVALEAEQAARDAAVAPGIDAALLAEYEALRAGLGGVGVAKLVGTQCGGCHLGLSAVEVARIRKVGQNEITHCEECGRLLVP